MLIVFLLALAVVTSLMGSPLVETQNGAALTVAQPSDLAERLVKIEKEIEEKRKEFGVPGVAVAIVKDDKVIFQKGFGLRDVEHNLPVTAETIFALGSVTKSFTAMAAVISEDAGKLSLDDSPKRYLPYFNLQDPEADAKITVRDLLVHNSGLARSDWVTFNGVLNREEVIKVAGLAKPTAKFGKKFQYQNTMYSVAGEVVAKANGTTWEKFIEERIFKPLGMKSSNTSTKRMVRVSDHATGYSLEDKVATKAALHDMPNIAPAGAINSNVKDMVKWIRLMLGGGKFEGKRIVSENGFNEIVRERISVPDFADANYGLGWLLSERSGHPLIWHPGEVPGFSALVEMVPDQSLGFVVLLNAEGSPSWEVIRDIVFDNIAGKPETAAATTASIPQETANLAEYKELIDQYELGEMLFEITTKGNNVVFLSPTNPPFTLIEKEKDNFGFVELPDSFRALFKRGATGEITGFLMKQFGGEFEIKRIPPSAKSDITVDELMAKTIAAAGGETNLRKHRSITSTTAWDLENLGVTGQRVIYGQAPNMKTTITTLVGLGKKIASVREYFDGTQGGSEVSFAPPQRYKAEQLEDVRTRSDFYEQLDWMTLYKAVTVKRKAKVGDEEVYVVVKTPEKGNTVTDYFSAKSFLLVKRDRTEGAGEEQKMIVDIYSDFRNVDGEMIPFSVVTEDPEMGRIVGQVIEVKFNVDIPATTFRPAAK